MAPSRSVGSSSVICMGLPARDQAASAGGSGPVPRLRKMRDLETADRTSLGPGVRPGW